MPSESCAALFQESGVFSAYYMNGVCRTSDCDISIGDVVSSSVWASTHSCFDRKYPMVYFCVFLFSF